MSEPESHQQLSAEVPTVSALGASGLPMSVAGTPGGQSGGDLPVIDGYQVLGRLGQGGMGVVYRAVQLGTPHRVDQQAEPDGGGHQRAGRPNILLIVTDQQCADAMSCVAGRQGKLPGGPRTPAMDRLAARGVRFERAYCTQPLCVPSRMSMMTGRMPRQVGAQINRHPQPGAVTAPMLGRLLGDAGYECGYVGKWHLTLPKDERATHGFEWMAQENENQDSQMPGRCAEFLDKAHDRPFFLTAMFINPHDICEWARGQKLPRGPIGDPPAPDQCPPLPANHQPAADEPAVLRQVVGPSHPKAYPTPDWDGDHWRQYLWAYHRLVEKVDGEIGQVLEALEQSGHAENTIVIFTSDHGDGAAAHRWNQKQALFEECVRIPLIVCDPRQPRAGRVDEAHLVSLGLDLLPTICAYAGAVTPGDLLGRSLLPLMAGHEPAWRDCVFAETEFCSFGDSTGIQGRMARTADFKYVVYDRGNHREQLFDLRRDWGEMHNLAQSPAHRQVLQSHRDRLAQWMARTADPLAAMVGGTSSGL
ncbi:MAG: sulfatase-like hydrolase/transferase [Phycisphaeraceae bacterium]